VNVLAEPQRTDPHLTEAGRQVLGGILWPAPPEACWSSARRAMPALFGALDCALALVKTDGRLAKAWQDWLPTPR